MRQNASGLLRCLLLALLCLAVCVPACSSPAPRNDAPARRGAPEETGDGWQTASLDQVGINPELLNQLLDRIRENDYQNLHGILIVKDGKLVFEEYFGGYAWNYAGDQFRGEYVEYGIDTLHNLASVTKSFTSALVGIAVERGFIQSVDEKTFAFFPKYAHLSDDRKSEITLEHLLTMSSGLEWNEMQFSYDDDRNDLVQLFVVSDPIKYILAKPAVHEAGTRWYYNGGGVNLLGEVIRETSGQRMDAFAQEYLFAPLGITDYEWDHINSDMIHASGNLQLRPRDMAKFGYLFLNGGVWQGERILSEEWVATSIQKHTSPGGGDGYGYLWWLDTYHVGSASIDSFYAAGWGGQRINVFPSLDMVVVFTGGNYVGKEPVDEILTRYILPSAR